MGAAPWGSAEKMASHFCGAARERGEAGQTRTRAVFGGRILEGVGRCRKNGFTFLWRSEGAGGVRPDKFARSFWRARCITAA